jgi:predicted Zn finger-like uncharacterized protein
VIVTCEQCETRFRLDDSRLPAKGARVRCSRCKHAFLVRPPGATASAAIDAIAAEAARTAKPATPDVAWDLEDGADPGSTIQRRAAASIPAVPGETEDESDWRFEDEVPELGDSGASLDLPNGQAPAPPTEPDANESSFAHLGDPESWDLLSTTSSDLGTTGKTLIGGLQPLAPRAVEAAAVEAIPAAPEPVRSKPARAVALPVERAEPALAPIAEPPPAMQRAAHAAIAVLVALALAGALRTAPVDDTELGRAPLGALTAEDLDARLVDNAVAGPVVVVSGALRNESSAPQRIGSAVTVVALDERGSAIEAESAIARPAFSPETLRAENPRDLAASAKSAAAALADRTLAPGEKVGFDAVFAQPPVAAARFALEAK